MEGHPEHVVNPQHTPDYARGPIDMESHHHHHHHGAHTPGDHSPVDHVQVPAFLTKTYDIVNDPSSDMIVSWGQTGETFVIHNTTEFCTSILPSHFKHNNLASFVRQLNIYGFQKVGNKHMWEFRHERFRRGERHMLAHIKRKTPNKRMWISDGQESQKTETILTELLQLKQRQELLEMNLVQVMNTNDSLWNDLVACKQQQREIQDNLQKILYFLMTVYQHDEEKQAQLPSASGLEQHPHVQTHPHQVLDHHHHS
eukprot:c13026_g1_i3.p1 GENE.c13026_g1_i3~~c13026_g1_i3.p1  ORF type:complete len:256 (-),score=58.06 c13026_g1_i3:232-999(-)